MNYKGLSPAIGKVGAEKIFKQSVTKHSLHYNFFHGDGDSKAFPAVQNAYSPEEPVKKYECIGHYHERVGTRLQKKDVKGVDGKGCLTNAKINTLQNYFDIALCQNVGDIDKMISACKASVFHVAQLSKNSYQYQHDMLIEPVLVKIKMLLHWMYVQPFFLCTTIYLNERIYQNVCMGVHKA